MMQPGNTSPPKKALIVFLKPPVKGRVKTRLARSVGEEQALAVYRAMVQLTLKAADESGAEVFAYMSESGDPGFAMPAGFRLRVQQGETLGLRMENAFKEVFEEGFGKVLIIGSDCPQMSPAVLGEAYRYLDAAPVVAGPATDGGYFLLGMTALVPGIFELARWSHAQVLDETLAILQRKRVGYALMSELSDLDDAQDLRRLSHLLPETVFAGEGEGDKV
ncbi:MAG: TIGR04282 family arsenosugar biosynthesis glycosyltransferase [Candidatus Cyclonatronum sp.]|uniref:TIGR04282 family arsenosugar biosynthesis glycosyltransferase n=1 Tax=Cyclonatronum sp. TaxID=3024185 RepID=UPI0025C52A26|nr:TIGR04282 family arsenosugar biosynthesis glycosyltransferase [Cyclonatronum sp.]MCH8487204.1 TIGR04282 family arsenosugar biosynthesis glycosyltransferase [Cyclonatronum sp.]